MATVKSNSKFVTVTIRNKVVVVDFETEAVHNLECSSQFIGKHESNLGTLDETVFIPCADISRCGNWFVFSFKKCLSLWNTCDWSLIGDGVLQRSASKVRFSPDGKKIIVADKGGDIYVYLRDNLSSQGSLLLGHLSVLFDVIISEDEKYIISCDRDEKIRVSCYPNAYSINSYCLGHEEFVTSINILPHSQNILISTSGDRTVRFWDFRSGKELLKYHCSGDIDEASVQYDDDVPFIDNVAITKCVLFQTGKSESVACLLLNNYKGCLLYCIKGTNQNLTCETLPRVNFSDIACDIFFGDNVMWYITSEEKFNLSALQWNVSIKKFESVNESVYKIIKNVNKQLDSIEGKFRNKVAFMYKKHFDTVQEYHKRKNDKLDESSKKNRI
ncbi:tRNA (guanine-N(7)-)-methyltransferase non-catalytic subunit wuho [Lycorma delicatula]|uniref:tRNA (guanine-N(7)-)-methyltransferase non-catalytic subunit wuho n=1 Tax=Lycorma delicatula TaxID=130591 RepID=UPI003F515879